jgi:hypothetical protein
VSEYGQIIAHNDFDGVVSAAIISRALGIQRFMFAGPRQITQSRLTISEKDVVCDLPYPLRCGLWFDHHEGNIEEVRLRGIDPSAIPGRAEPRDSCARVVYDYFGPKAELPEFYAETVREADVLDSFKFSSIEEWRRETPGKVVDGAIQGQEGPPRQRDDYLRRLVPMLRDRPLAEVASLDEIRRAFESYSQQEERIIEIIRRDAHFLEGDPAGEFVVLDLTAHKRPPRMIKKLAFLLFPEAKAVLELRNLMRSGVKTTDLSISMSLGIVLSGVKHPKDVGEIMRELNIGDGHTGAGAGTVSCRSKAEMLAEKDRLVKEIMRLWRSQV